MINDGRRLDLNFGTFRLVNPSEPTQPRSGPPSGVHAGNRPDLGAHGVNHQRVPFVMADRISTPARRHAMGSIKGPDV
jgi:hypothetical protein